MDVNTFMENVINSPAMLDEISKSPQGTQKVFDEINALSNGRIPGALHFRLMKAIGETVVINPETAAHFDDDQMLLLYKHYFQEWFNLPQFRERTALNNPVFEGIQCAFSSCAINNHVKCFAWLMQNADISLYDNDGLTILHAIQNNHPVILGLIACNADPETFGTSGSLGMLIHPRIRAAVNNTSWIQPDIRNKLAQFRAVR